MSDNLYTSGELRIRLRQQIKMLGVTQNELARRIGITNGHLSRVLHGEKEPGPKILTWLGLVAVTYYVVNLPRSRRAA